MLKTQQGVLDATGSDLREIADRVGQTPLQPIYLAMKRRTYKIHLKLEGANPTGSMKDRVGAALIRQLHSQRLLREETVVIESSSGNLGVALALQCKARGYPLVMVVDPKATPENIAKMRTLGAQIDMVHLPDINDGYLLTRLARVQELCSRHQNYIWTNQYANSANPHIHYSSTGPEIYQQMNGNVDLIFVPVSTGGTLAGIGQFFREVKRSTQIVGVDAYGSVVFGFPARARKLTGIGSSRRSNFIHEGLYDSQVLIRDEEAFAFCRSLYKATGIKVGGSSGAVIAACAKYLEAHPSAQNIVCVCADDGENYNSSIFADAWLQACGIALSEDHLGAVVDMKR